MNENLTPSLGKPEDRILLITEEETLVFRRTCELPEVTQ